jgi:hypothetical protein
MKLENLKYSDKWLEFEFISLTEIQNQNIEFDKGEDKNPEHYRYKSFLRWIESKNEFTDIEIEQFVQLVELDEDQLMASAALMDLYKSPRLKKTQLETIESKLITFGNWAAKQIAKIKNRREEEN